MTGMYLVIYSEWPMHSRIQPMNLHSEHKIPAHGAVHAHSISRLKPLPLVLSLPGNELAKRCVIDRGIDKFVSISIYRY